MQRKINSLRLQVLIVTLSELLIVGGFLTLYLLNVWNIKENLPVEVIGYVTAGMIIFDCFFVWRILFSVYRLRQKSDIRTSDVVGGDIQEAYIFGKLGFVVVDQTGTVLWISDLFTQRSMNIINENIYTFCPKLKDFIEKDVGDSIVVKLHGYDYNVKFLRNAGLFIFKDVSEYETLSKYATDQATCIGIISIDNYNDITSSNADFNDAINNVKSIIVDYSKNYGVLLRVIRNDTYFAICNHESLARIIADGFSILDKVREATLKVDTKPTLSIGFAYDFPDVNKLNDLANDALDIAMSRGGDQVVVSAYGQEMKFYGGKSEAQEKRNRVKTRVLADSLISLINNSQKVLIMGHANMDMDAFGACLGMKAICTRLKKDARVVVDLKNTEAKTRAALNSSFGKEELEKLIVTSKDAEDMINGNTLLVVVDVHIPSMVMAPKLVDMAAKIVVIDHHRRAEEYIDSPVFNHIDPAASSACELISEFIRFSSINPRIELPSTYATIMLSGIFLDSGYFKSRSTGIRTFEAATILKEYGADNSLADDFLKDDYEEHKEVTDITTNLDTPYYGVVIATANPDRLYDHATIAKAANLCLTFKGVHAAFVMGKVSNREMRVSARSDGTINVSLLAERLGGGGHFTSAAVTFNTSDPREVKNAILAVLESSLTEATNKGLPKNSEED